MKNVLITGANRGIGFEISRQLGRKGFHVIISGRDGKRLSVALSGLKDEGISAEMILMDVSKTDSVQLAAEALASKEIKLDVLINNAAILLKEDMSIISMDPGVFDQTININSFGPHRVSQAFIPLINNPGRIINISSGGGSMTESVGGWAPAYCVSKTLLNSITRQMAYELSERGISVNAVCPGWVRTEMGGRSATRPVEKGAETPVWLAADASYKLTGKFFRDKTQIPW
jgi:NAD(P)-dependent dehydrogenase (short-subunit alcohol dehydrogenase family)